MHKLLLAGILSLFSLSTAGVQAEASIQATAAYNKARSSFMAKGHNDCKQICQPCQIAKCDLTFTVPIDIPFLLSTGQTLEISLTNPNGKIASTPVTSTSIAPVVFEVESPACCGTYTLTIKNTSINILSGIFNFIHNPIVTNSCNNSKLIVLYHSLEENLSNLPPGHSFQILIDVGAPLFPCKQCKCDD